MREPDGLNERFYRAYNPTFLYSKALALARELERRGTHEAEADELDDKHFESLEAELYFTEMHQFESMWALLLACAQPLPHWLYLTTYRQKEFDESLRAFLAGSKWRRMSFSSEMRQSFLAAAVYSDSISEDPNLAARWPENLANLDWVISRLGRRFDGAPEYNAYKHGTRVVTGRSQITLTKDGSRQSAIGWQSDESLSFLEVQVDDDGHREVFETTVHFSHVESLRHIWLMAQIVKTVCNTRLAAFTGDFPELSTFFAIDKDLLIREGKHFRFRWTV